MPPPTSRINNATLDITDRIRLSLDYHYLETKRSYDSIELLPLLSRDRTLPCLFKTHMWEQPLDLLNHHEPILTSAFCSKFSSILDYQENDGIVQVDKGPSQWGFQKWGRISSTITKNNLLLVVSSFNHVNHEEKWEVELHDLLKM